MSFDCMSHKKDARLIWVKFDQGIGVKYIVKTFKYLLKTIRRMTVIETCNVTSGTGTHHIVFK